MSVINLQDTVLLRLSNRFGNKTCSDNQKSLDNQTNIHEIDKNSLLLLSVAFIHQRTFEQCKEDDDL